MQTKGNARTEIKRRQELRFWTNTVASARHADEAHKRMLDQRPLDSMNTPSTPGTEGARKLRRVVDRRAE